MRSLFGAFLVLSLGLILFPAIGLTWVLLLGLGGALLFRTTGRGGFRAYWSWLDELLFAGEQAIVAISLAVMAAFVFIDVVWRTAHSAEGSSAWGFALGILGLSIIGGLTARASNLSIPKRVGLGLGAFVVLAVLCALIYSAPNGFGWSQRLALVLILWVGLLGGSMATKQGRHIAIDAVKRVLPDRLKRGFEIASSIVTIGLCLFLAALGWVYAHNNWVDWIESERRAFIFEGLSFVPYWAATIPIPIGFGLMAFRFFGVMLTGAKEVDLLTSVGAASEDISAIERPLDPLRPIKDEPHDRRKS